MARKQDILNLPAPRRPPRLTSRRIGIHTSSAGGVQNAAERAYRLGCNTFQIFSSSPRQWAPYDLSRPQCCEMMRLREKYDLKPMAIHVNYLVNLASTTPLFLKKSIEAFRGEVERALALGAEYLVLHPGSWRGLTREDGLRLAAESIKKSLDGLDAKISAFQILIENTAGAEFSLGGSFEQVAELLHRLQNAAPVGACLDTCHTHVAGYDLVSEEGYAETMRQIEATIGTETVRVWHTNDAKAARGSKLDRHEQIGQGMIGPDAFRRLLNDKRFAQCAFIAEVPVEQPDDDRKNVALLKSFVISQQQQVASTQIGGIRRQSVK
jgi:deoxyribonuclease-4